MELLRCCGIVESLTYCGIVESWYHDYGIVHLITESWNHGIMEYKLLWNSGIMESFIVE